MPSNPKKYAFYISLGTILLVGCQGNPYLSSYTAAKPNESDLVGTWVPDNDSMKDIRERGGYDIDNANTKLILRPDGGLEMLNMPDWWQDPFGRSHGTFRSDSGTWMLREHSPGTWWEIELTFPKAWTTTPIRREKPPYLIHFTLGDPDAGHAMTFVRQKSVSAAMAFVDPRNRAQGSTVRAPASARDR